jgi:predicted MarR family transcription regulator
MRFGPAPGDVPRPRELRFDGTASEPLAMERMTTSLDKHWHLAADDYEVELTELEFSILRVSAAFERWRSDCMACCCDQSFSGADAAVLHVVRMHNRPKSISEIGRLLNRDDQSNLQYGIRKLMKAGVIEKFNSGDSKKGVTYVVTELGREVTDRFAQFRRELLLTLTRSISTKNSLDDISRILNLLAGMYDQASCIAAAHRIAP